MATIDSFDIQMGVNDIFKWPALLTDLPQDIYPVALRDHALAVTSCLNQRHRAIRASSPAIEIYPISHSSSDWSHLAKSLLMCIKSSEGFNITMDPNNDLPDMATCTTCRFQEDKSNYWTAVMYFKHPNGSYTRVPQIPNHFTGSPNGGMTVYYIQPPNLEPVTAFRKGFRMITGNAMLRSYDRIDPDSADAYSVTFRCWESTAPFDPSNMSPPGVGNYDTVHLPNKKCPGGIRANIFFPSCWDGVNLDSPDHRSHVAFMTGKVDRNTGLILRSGTCPSTHPVRIPLLFYEVYWDTRPFNDMWPTDGSQPFVLSMGDPTGYGHHGDYVFGWEGDSLQRAMNTCTDIGGVPEGCRELTLLTDAQINSCTQRPQVDERVEGTYLDKLPGCNPIQAGPAEATMDFNTTSTISPSRTLLRTRLLAREVHFYEGEGRPRDPASVSGMVKQEDGDNRIVNVKDEPEEFEDAFISDSNEEDTKVAIKRDVSPEVEIISVRLQCEPDEKVIILDSPKRPRKKQRLVMEDNLPTAVKADSNKEVVEVKVKKFKEKKEVKVKKLEMQLSLDIQTERLKRINADEPYPVELDKVLTEFTVSRGFMSKFYGGGNMETFPKVAAHRYEQHGFEFCYLHRDYQPNAPPLPGYHGLFLDSHGGEDIDGVQNVFTRMGSGKWQYMGQYEMKSTKSLTRREWARQKETVRNTWGTEICRQSWGNFVRARIYARKELGREPTADEVKEVKESQVFTAITPEDVISAYDAGEERLGVWTMKCVGYKTEFQLELIDKFSSYVPPPRKKKGEEGAKESKRKKGKGTSSAESKSAAKKRKRSDLSDSGLSEPEGKDEAELKKEEGREQFEEVVYRPRGTRSRPIRL
ncbi:unnamed protein product [Cyclocybe aegerita]|uniref:DUF1996 domain-containing protein n=1 Tax=Cyclocybe aegerita TaxID=1973307 RepID=A0A8S0VQR4_CYCAE|nr:unnamed protein product [Cyclocybe aegerita]